MKITYAVGDVHGMREQLEQLVDKSVMHSTGQHTDVKFVFLGDYIDRGPESKGVVDFLLKLDGLFERVFLRGNHEDLLLHDWGNFCHNGGWETLKSYGWDPEVVLQDPGSQISARQAA